MTPAATASRTTASSLSADIKTTGTDVRLVISCAISAPLDPDITELTIARDGA